MARRVNKRFLIIFSIIVLGGITAAVIFAIPVRAAWRADRARKALGVAEKAMADAKAETTPQGKREKLDLAVRSYAQAAGANNKNPELYLKLGDAYSELTLYDVFQYIRASRMAWDHAVTIDPAYLPAHRRLMESYYQESQIRPAPSHVFGLLEEKAQTVFKLDSKDRRARALQYIAPLNQWLDNIETPPAKIETAIQELNALLEEDPKHPDNADLVYFAAAATAKRGGEKRRGGSDGEGEKLINQAQQIFKDAIRAQDQNSSLQYRYFELLMRLRMDETEQKKQDRYLTQAKEALNRALELAQPGDPNYVMICIAAQQQQLAAKQADKAEKILLDAMKNKERENDQRLRLALARLWRSNPVKRSEAIELLQRQIEDIGFKGVQARLRLGLEIETNIELTTILIDELSQARDLAPAERQERLKTIEKYCQRAQDKAGEIAAVLKLRGRIESLRGGADAPIKAIQTYGKAQTQFKIERGQEDPELMFFLARAYMQAGMTGQAKQQLLKLLELRGDNLQVHMMLAQLLVGEGDVINARKHVAFLRQTIGDDPSVLSMAIATADPQKDKQKIAADYAKLPESTRAERLSKASVALSQSVNQTDEAVRLYKLILKADPADFDAVNACREVLSVQGKKDQALEVLRDAQKAKPDDKRFGLIITQLEGATLQQMVDAGEKLIREMYPDAYQRELKLYEFEMVQIVPDSSREDARKHREAAYKHLLEAEKTKPEDGRAMDLLFQYHLGEQNWDKAAQYVEKLAAANWDTAGGLMYRFRLAMVKNEIPAAINFAREMTTRYPEFARSWVALAQGHQATRQQSGFEQAITNYTVALDKQTENADALQGVIACYYQLGRPNDAFRYIEQAMKYHPNSAFFREQFKAWHMVYGDPAKVLEMAAGDRDARPDDVNRWVALGRIYYAAARKRDANQAKYIAGAKATFMDAIKKWPGERILWAHLIDIAELTRDLAYGESVLKDMASREEFKNKADPTAYLSELYLRLGEDAKAEATMKDSIKQFPENMELRRRMAQYYAGKKRYNDALAQLDPNSQDKLSRLQIVQIYISDKRFTEAEKILKGLITLDPNDAQLHALMGVVLNNDNRQEKAMDELNTALGQDPRNLLALYSRATIFLKSTPPRVDDAIKDLLLLRDASASKGIPQVEGRTELANAFRLKGRTEEAIREYDAILKVDPQRDEVRVTLCGLYASAKPPQWTDIERLLREATEREPRRTMWRRMEAKMLSARNQHDQAIRVIRDAINMVDNKDPKAAAEERGDMARDYFDILEAAKNWQQLLAECDQTLRMSPEAANTWWIYLKRAIARRNRDQKNEAMADFQKAFEIAQRDGNPDVLFSIVDKIRTHMGVEAAIDRVTLLVSAAKEPTEVARWRVVLAYLHMTNNNTAKAQELVELARAAVGNMNARDKQTTLTIAGTVYMLSNEYDKARTVYEQLLEVKPNDIAALNNLACIYAEHIDPPNYVKAMELSNRAYDVMRTRNPDANILDTHGWVHVLTGGTNLDLGIDFLTQAVKAGEIPEAYYHLAKAYLMKKLPRPAKESLTRAFDLLIERQNSGQPVDQRLKQKMEQAMQEADKALLDAQTSVPAP